MQLEEEQKKQEELLHLKQEEEQRKAEEVLSKFDMKAALDSLGGKLVEFNAEDDK